MKVSYLTQLRKMAIMGDMIAMWILGEAYDSGYFTIGRAGRVERVGVNRRLSLKWLRRSADRGCVGAMLSLASVYMQRKRISKFVLDSALALEKRAWRLGESLAANNIAITYSFMGQLRLSRNWLERYYNATKDGLLFSLALAAGYGGRKDSRRAVRILDKMIKTKCVEDEALKQTVMSLRTRIVNGDVPQIARPISLTKF